jgi:hypothetical protein
MPCFPEIEVCLLSPQVDVHPSHGKTWRRQPSDYGSSLTYKPPRTIEILRRPDEGELLPAERLRFSSDLAIPQPRGSRTILRRSKESLIALLQPSTLVIAKISQVTLLMKIYNGIWTQTSSETYYHTLNCTLYLTSEWSHNIA